MPLADFAGSDGLVDNTTYFWRMRADDQWDAWSTWSTGELWFIYGTPPPTVKKTVLYRQTPGPEDEGVTLEFSWERSGKGVYIEAASNSFDGTWLPLAGPIIGTNHSITLPANTPAMFYRVLTE